MNNDSFLKLLNEQCGCGGEEEESDEILMQNLAKIHEYAGEILTCINNGGCPGEIEDWVEDKISKCSQSMSDVKHYLEYKKSGYAIQQHGMDPGHNIEGGSPMPLGRPEMPAIGDEYGGGIENVSPVMDGIGIVIASEPESEEMPYGEEDMISDLDGSSFDEEADEMEDEYEEEEGYVEEGEEDLEESFSLKRALKTV